MFTQATIYQTGLAALDQGLLAKELERRPFVPCMSTQEQSVGWTSPRTGGALVEKIGEWRIMALTIETKKVPPAIVQRRVEEACAAIERETGRKPIKKTRRELKDQVVLELLPNAFPKRKVVEVAVRTDGLTLIGSTSAGALETVITEVVSALAQVEVAPLQTPMSPAGWMASMLHETNEGHDSIDDFSVGDSCELKGAEGKAVRYANHDLHLDEIRGHLAEKQVAKLGLTYDGRVSFVLTDALQLKSIEVLDSVEIDEGKDVDQFDATAFLTLSTLGSMIDSLRAALGGEESDE